MSFEYSTSGRFVEYMNKHRDSYRVYDDGCVYYWCDVEMRWEYWNRLETPDFLSEWDYDTLVAMGKQHFDEEDEG